MAGTICREAAGSCDLPEYCTGASPYCPANVYLLDGSSCAYGEAYCNNGMCMTHHQQCVQLWGPGEPQPYPTGILVAPYWSRSLAASQCCVSVESLSPLPAGVGCNEWKVFVSIQDWVSVCGAGVEGRTCCCYTSQVPGPALCVAHHRIIKVEMTSKDQVQPSPHCIWSP